MHLRTILMGAAACALLSGPAFAQTSTAPAGSPPPPPPMHKHHHHEAMATTGSDRLDLLEKRVEEQAEEIHELKTQLNGGAATPAAPVTAAQFEALQNQVYETSAAVKQATTPHDKKLHMKGVTFTFGGFLAAESVWRSNSLESDIGSPGFSKIPFAGPGAGNPTAVGGTATSTGVGNAVNIAHTHEFRFSARQSRVSGLVEADVSPDTHLSGYGEFDFLGAAASANSNESNSYTPRVRNLYGAVDWSDIGVHFLFGQSWSLATLDTHGMSERSEAPPATIDAQYVPGFVWTRQPQLRLTKEFGDDFWVGVSVENPQTTLGGTLPADCSLKSGATSQACTADGTVVISNNGNSFSGGGLNSTGDAEFNPGIQLSLNQMPDVIGKVAWEPFGGIVHIEGVGILRDFYDRTESILPASAPCTNSATANPANNCYGAVQLGTAANHSNTGGGGGVAGLIKVWPDFVDVQFDSLFGTGIGRYGSGQLPDATYTAAGTLKPLNEDMEMVGVTLHATPDFDIYVIGGRENEDSSFFKVNGSNGGYGNPAFTNTGCFDFTSTASCTGNVRDVEQITAGLWDKAYNGDYGSFRIGLQYSYTYDKAFAGAGGAPHTSDNMIFTSFRYYPF